jgi:ATP-dependent DNA ligase/predicted DNA-binding WGR domain protein
MERRTFLQENGKQRRIWDIAVTGNYITTNWGIEGGKMQVASEAANGVNEGQANFKTPAQHAQERADRMIRLKTREGYREVGADGQYLQAVEPPPRLGSDGTPTFVVPFDFDNLPSNLCFYKPDNSIGATMKKKVDAGGVVYTRKRDGLAFIIARGVGAPKLYSRRMLRQHDDEVGTALTWDDRFPHLVRAAAGMPENTILLGELIVDRDGKDDPEHVKSITKSLTPTSLADQEAEGKPLFYIWDLAFLRGDDLLSTMPWSQRQARIYEVLTFSGNLGPELALCPTQVLNWASYAEALQFLQTSGWEGFVVVDPNSTYEGKGWNLKGKPDRPASSCAKAKLEFEDDFLAYWDPAKGWGAASTKERYRRPDGAAGIESLALFQLNPKGELVYICDCASGLTEEQKKSWADMSIYPQVITVKYTSRTYISRGDKTNALTFPRFSASRPDKMPTECFNTEL